MRFVFVIMNAYLAWHENLRDKVPGEKRAQFVAHSGGVLALHMHTDQIRCLKSDVSYIVWITPSAVVGAQAMTGASNFGVMPSPSK